MLQNSLRRMAAISQGLLKCVRFPQRSLHSRKYHKTKYVSQVLDQEHVNTSYFTLNFTEKSSVAVLSSGSLQREGCGFKSQPGLWRFPQLKGMWGNWLHETPHLNWSDSKCASASSIASLPLARPVQLIVVRRSYNEEHDIRAVQHAYKFNEEEHEVEDLPGSSIRQCWQSLSLLYPTNYSLKFAVLHRGDDFCRQIFRRQCVQVHRLCAWTSVFLVPQWKSAKTWGRTLTVISNFFLKKKGMQKNKYQIELNRAELNHLDAQFMC